MLIGEKICLAPLLQGDAGLIYNWHNTVEIMHLDGIYRPISQARFDDWFNTIGKDPSRVVFSIRRRSDMNLVGYVQAANIHGVNRCADIGIMIGDKANRGQGYGTEALGLLVGFCWHELNLQRLALMVIGDNPRAIAAYRHVGFEVEGVTRRAVYTNGGFVNCTLMAILRPEAPPMAGQMAAGQAMMPPAGFILETA